MRRASILARAAKCSSGATAIEFALVAAPLFMLLIGAIEVGRAIDIHNQLRRAADVAARAIMLDPASSTAAIHSAMQKVMHAPDRSRLSLKLTPETIDGLNYILIEASFPYKAFAPLVLLSPATITVTRRTPRP